MKIVSRRFKFSSAQGHQLVGRKYFPENRVCKAFLYIIPGFSTAGKDRFIDLQRYLAHREIHSVSYDYRGIGESEGVLDETTICDLITDSQLFISLDSEGIPHKRIFILGYCLGSYVALAINSNNRNKSKGLVLLSPTSYEKAVDNLKLTQDSTQKLRLNMQKIQSTTFNNLKSYPGNSLIIYGSDDKEVPTNIKEKYMRISNTSQKTVVIPKGKHSLLHVTTQNEKDVQKQIMKHICDFITVNLK